MELSDRDKEFILEIFIQFHGIHNDNIKYINKNSHLI